MRKKLPLFLATLLAVSLLCTSLAGAADLPSPSLDDEDLVTLDDMDVPLIDVPEIRIWVDADEGDTATVPEEELLDAVDVVASGEAVRITIATDGSRVVFPKAGLDAANGAGAELKVETPYGQLILPVRALSAYPDDVTLVIEKLEKDTDGNVLEEVCLRVYLICQGVTYYSWSGSPLVLYVPVPDDTFVVGNVYSVEQFDEDGVKLHPNTPFAGECVEVVSKETGAISKWIIITNNSGYLAYFKALPEAVEGVAPFADPTVVASPLTAPVTPSETPAPSFLDSVANWFDSVANQVMRLFGL